MKDTKNVQNSQKVFRFGEKCIQSMKKRYQFAKNRVVIHFLHTLFITALSNSSVLYESRQSKKSVTDTTRGNGNLARGIQYQSRR